jgi:hypothetical protein
VKSEIFTGMRAQSFQNFKTGEVIACSLESLFFVG